MPNDPDLVRRWALVLDSQGIPYQIQRAPDGWTLIVDQAHAGAASEVLQTYADENADEDGDRYVEEPGRRAKPRSNAGFIPVAVGIATAALLLGFFFVTGEFSQDSPWFAAGAADGSLIREGELWRVVTALTLHADLGHIVANTFSWALFATAVMITVGSGVGLWLVLLAGAGGNLINALLRGTGYLGVGASTAVFGAVGVLTGYRLVTGDRRKGRAGVWTPLVAGMLLFVLLGTGEHTDILAHLLGLLVGIVFGAAAGRFISEPPRRTLQWALTAAAIAAVVACWWLALRGESGGV